MKAKLVLCSLIIFTLAGCQKSPNNEHPLGDLGGIESNAEGDTEGGEVSPIPIDEAGGFNGGGGGAAVCRDQNKRIISAVFLDLYEGRIRFGLKIPESLETPQTQLARAVDKIPEEFERSFTKEYLEKTVDAFQFLPKGVAIVAPPDTGSDYGSVIPEGCSVELVGYYETNGKLKIAREVYRALSPTDRAAFILHEAIYKIARDTSFLKDSALSRRTVASLFATNANAEDISTMLKKQMFIHAYPWWQLSSIAPYPAQKLMLASRTTSFTLRVKDLPPIETENYRIVTACGPGTLVDRRDLAGDQTVSIQVPENCLSLNFEIAGQGMMWKFSGKYELLKADGTIIYTGESNTPITMWILLARPAVVPPIPEPL